MEDADRVLEDKLRKRDWTLLIAERDVRNRKHQPKADRDTCVLKKLYELRLVGLLSLPGRPAANTPDGYPERQVMRKDGECLEKESRQSLFWNEKALQTLAQQRHVMTGLRIQGQLLQNTNDRQAR